jgi:hypothetical protein
MNQICKNTQNGFLLPDGSVDKSNLPLKDATFCGYNYDSHRCLVNIDCTDFNTGWNNYAYIAGCDTKTATPRSGSDYCSIPDYLYPENCEYTKSGEFCLPYGSNCQNEYDTTLGKIGNACNYDSDGCINTISNGNIIVYTYDKNSNKCKSPNQPDIDPSTEKGCRKSGEPYIWDGFNCFTQQTFPVITGVHRINTQLWNFDGIGFIKLTLNIDPNFKSFDLTQVPTYVSILSYQLDDGQKIGDQIYFDTSSIKDNYLFTNNQIIIFHANQEIVISSNDVTDNHVSLSKLKKSNPPLNYYLGITFTWKINGSSYILTSNDLLNTDLTNTNNYFQY